MWHKQSFADKIVTPPNILGDVTYQVVEKTKYAIPKYDYRRSENSTSKCDCRREAGICHPIIRLSIIEIILNWLFWETANTGSPEDKAGCFVREIYFFFFKQEIFICKSTSTSASTFPSISSRKKGITKPLLILKAEDLNKNLHTKSDPDLSRFLCVPP